MIQPQQDALLRPAVEAPKKPARRPENHSPSLRRTRGRCVLAGSEVCRLRSEEQSGASEHKFLLRCADGIPTWKRRPRVRGSGRTGQMQTEEEEEEAIQEKRYNFPFFQDLSPVFCLSLFRAEVVRTLAAPRQKPSSCAAAPAAAPLFHQYLEMK